MTTRRPRAKSSFGFGIFPETDEPSDDVSDLPTSDSSLPPKPRDPKPKNEPRPSRYSQRNGSGNNYAAPKFGPVGKKGEPLCLAEQLALERSQGLVEPDYDETYEKLRQSGDATYLSILDAMTMSELLAEARSQHIREIPEKSSRKELLFQILKARIKQNGLMYGEGTLEILPDMFGFLRSSDYHYLSSPDDIYISPSQIRRFGLRPGCVVAGQIRPPKENERYFALLRVEAINHEAPNMLNHRPMFDSLTPVYPNSRIPLVTRENDDLDIRVLSRFVPLGFGQRGLIIGPPKTGKTTLLQKIAAAALADDPELYVFILMLEERPEEATETVRRLKSPHCEVICSLFDDPPQRHIHVSEIVLEKAKRMVECGKNVLLLLDSITGLARAWNAETALPGKNGSRTSETLNMQSPKKFFGSARKAEEGGSLTILATMSIQTDHVVDDTVFETFKGTGNLELYLDRDLADKRIWPAIDIHRSGVRHEDFLLSEGELQSNLDLRRQILGLTPEEAIGTLRDNLS